MWETPFNSVPRCSDTGNLVIMAGSHPACLLQPLTTTAEPSPSKPSDKNSIIVKITIMKDEFLSNKT